MIDLRKLAGPDHGSQCRYELPGVVNVTIPAAEFLLGDEAVRLLRAIRQAYYSDSFVWGTAGAGQDDGLRFMQTYERLMCAMSPTLNMRVMDGGPHSGPVPRGSLMATFEGGEWRR